LINLYCLGMGDCISGTAVVMVWFHTPPCLRDKTLVFISTLLVDFYHHLACKNTKKLSFLNMICHHQYSTELKIFIIDK